MKRIINYYLLLLLFVVYVGLLVLNRFIIETREKYLPYKPCPESKGIE